MAGVEFQDNHLAVLQLLQRWPRAQERLAQERLAQEKKTTNRDEVGKRRTTPGLTDQDLHSRRILRLRTVRLKDSGEWLPRLSGVESATGFSAELLIKWDAVMDSQVRQRQMLRLN